MKKQKYFSLILWLLICFALTALLGMVVCMQNTSKTKSISVKAVKSYLLMENLLNNVHMPRKYLITYEIESENGRLSQITEGRDEDGKMYFKNPVQEFSFIPIDGEYLLYYANANGTFVEKNKTAYTEKCVENMTRKFLKYAKKVTLMHNSVAKYIGDSAIAGRKCKDYEISVKLLSFSQKYIFAIDNETNTCLDWKLVVNTKYHNLFSRNNFKCIVFKTKNVQLPDLANTTLTIGNIKFYRLGNESTNIK